MSRRKDLKDTVSENRKVEVMGLHVHVHVIVVVNYQRLSLHGHLQDMYT